MKFDTELLYAGAMFHDMGLLKSYSSANERFEVDGANAVLDFLTRHGISKTDVDLVWTGIALHTTPGIPCHMHQVVALVTAGVEMDVLGVPTPNSALTKAHRDYWGRSGLPHPRCHRPSWRHLDGRRARGSGPR